jgi:hypothetical protein
MTPVRSSPPGKRQLPPLRPIPHGRVALASEPVVFHCNHYNYWLQKTVRLGSSVPMDGVIVDAASAGAYALVKAASEGLTLGSERLQVAADAFAELGFGTLDFGELGDQGGPVSTPVSHYGQCLVPPAGSTFSERQELFDQGFVEGAAAAAFGLPHGSFTARVERSASLGQGTGAFELSRRSASPAFAAQGVGAHGPAAPPPPSSATNVDETAILSALAGLDLAGNEEGLVPRFGVYLTRNLAGFYNRVSFEFSRRMAALGLLEPAEALLVDAGYHCAFNTFGGIMVSGEWDAVVRPQCKTREDWVHGMVAVVNALGWGVWRVAELTPKRLVLQVWDDYESSGHLALYGKSSRPVSYLLAGGAAGLMNLVYIGEIESRPPLDDALFEQVFEHSEAFDVRQTKSFAAGDAYSEVVAERA